MPTCKASRNELIFFEVSSSTFQLERIRRKYDIFGAHVIDGILLTRYLLQVLHLPKEPVWYGKSLKFDKGEGEGEGVMKKISCNVIGYLA